MFFAGLSPCCSPAAHSTPSPPESLPSMFVRSWSQAPIVRGVKLQSFVRGIKLQSFVESGSNRSWSQAPIFGGSQIPIVRSFVGRVKLQSFVRGVKLQSIVEAKFQSFEESAYFEY